MKRILTALVLIPLILLLVFKAPLWAIALVTCIVALLATHEYLHIVRQFGVEPFFEASYALTALLFIGIYVSNMNSGFYELVPIWQYVVRHYIFFRPWTLGILALSPFLFLIAAMRRESLQSGFGSAVYSFFGFIYVSLSLALLISIRSEPDGVFWLVILFATVWAGDSVAMYVGKALGKHRLAPNVSPNKTWEGSIGSLLGSLVASWIALRLHDRIILFDSRVAGVDIHDPRQSLWWLHIPIPLLTFLFLVILLNIAGQLGDLVESVIKRGADIKDSGTLLPGHGGMLDRIDALLFAAPVLWYYLFIIRSLRPSW